MKYNFPKLPLLFSVIFLVFASGLFYYLYTSVKENTESSEQMRTEWQAETERRGNINSLERSLGATLVERNLLDSHFAQSSNVVPFLDTIEGLAGAAGGKAEIISVTLPKDNSGLLVQLEASGSFGSVYKFLTLLENSPYELEFNSMNLRSASNGDPNSQASGWSASLGVKLLTFIQ